MNHYRLTRPDVYSNPNCPGHKDKGARQGHYVDDAETPEEAIRLVRERLGMPHERFDVQVWNK